MFDLSSPFDTKPALRPARALLTPTWIGSLLLLVANDHWLKGSGMVPGVLTGKLSDFAGMLVAPTLLAALLGVRTKRALLACHLAVALVFAGIQLSLGFADAWAGLMAMIGHPWVITSDPTDLLALPFLILSWKLLVPEMDAELPALAPMQRTAVAGLSVFGLWSTVATSQETWIDDGDVWYEDVFGQAFVNNANDFDIALHIRPLRDDVILDCQQVANDPGRLLTEDAFGEAVHWTLPPRTNVAFDLGGNEECGAAWIAGEGIAPIIVFSDFHLEALPQQWFTGQSFDPTWLGSPGLAITFPAEGPSEWSGADDIRFVPKTRTPEQPESCELPADEMHFAWPTSVPSQPVQLLAAEAGVDGCFALELQQLAATNGESQPVGSPFTFYMCVPAAAMPFVADDVVRFTEDNWGGARELSIMLLDPTTLDTAVDEQGRVIRHARYLSGGSQPSWINPAINRNVVAVDSVSCPWDIDEDDGCADVQRLANLAIDGGQSYLQPGAPVSFADEPGPAAMVRTGVLGHARQLAVIDQACEQGSLQLSYDIDFAVVEEPLL